MAAPELINFSVSAGDNVLLEFVVETGEVEASGAAISWDLYTQEDGTPTDTTPIVSKELDYGIEFDASEGEVSFSVELEQADTLELRGNYYYEAKMVDGFGKNISLAYGLLSITGLSTELSPRSLKIRFPELAEYEDWVLQYALDLASDWVDSSWIAEDINIARLYLAAHFVTKAQAAADAGSGGGGTITSESIGRLSVSYSSSNFGSDSSGADLHSTIYGEYYLALLRGSHHGPVVI